MSNAAASPTTDLKDTLEEMRASVAARKGLAGALGKAILGVLDMLMALLADFRTGKLVPLPPSASDAYAAPGAGGSECAASMKVPALPDVAGGAGEGVLGLWGWWRRKNASAQNEERECYAPEGPAIAGASSAGGYTPAPGLPRSAGEGAKGGIRAVAPPAPQPSPSDAGLSREAAGHWAHGADDAVAYPSPSGIGPHFCQQKWEPVAGPAPRITSAGKPALKPTAFAAVAGYVRLSPRFPALQVGRFKKWGFLSRMRMEILFHHKNKPIGRSY